MLYIGELLPNKSDTTSFYRGREPLARLMRSHNLGLSMFNCEMLGFYDWSDLSLCDVIFSQRAHGEQMYNFLLNCKRWNKKIVLDYDDDFYSISTWHPIANEYSEEKLSWTTAIIRMADLIWASTEHLANQLRARGAINVIVVPNAHNDYIFPIQSKVETSSDNKVLYRGGASHYEDIADSADLIVNSFEKLPNVQLRMMSSRHKELDTKATGRMNLNYIHPLKFNVYFESLRQINAQYGITFLQQSTFNKSKSNIAWIEQTYAGSAFLAPKGFKEFEKPGITHFKNKITLPENAKELNELSWNYIKENLLLSKVNELRYESLMEL